ncbi:MAG: MerR family transcriptional regulator, partial [Oscillospiraceae bacterium]|nr:MerR family transcriptional regulator [Oscillospiraceae bacterium]
MTIKELEQAVGMTRANIRFYEQEGLISPRREENGYRDYSQADVETLERIKLLRRLQLGLEEIRALQNGESALPDVLAGQLKKLETDQAALDRARKVCQRLRETGTDYAALDPQPWLRELEREPVPASERFAPPVDELPPPTGHPWRRYFARMLDLILYGLPFAVLWALAFHLSPQTMNNALFKLFDAYLGIGVMLLLEPLLLSRWGTTPGKWIFGITVRDGDGNKLTWEQARHRTWTVFAKGMGYGIPFYEFWREYKSYQTVDRQERCDWERAEDGEPERMEIPDSTARCVAYVGVRLAVSVLAFLILAQAAMPPHRGELTLAEFCDNWNFYNSYT